MFKVQVYVFDGILLVYRTDLWNVICKTDASGRTLITLFHYQMLIQ